MSFNIGNVYINDSLYNGKDLYSDGPIEDEFLDIAQRGRFEDVLKHDNRWPILYHFSDIRENLLEWYPFSTEGDLLEIGAGCGGLTGLFCRKVKSVTSVELSMKRSMVNAYRNHECDNLEIIVGNFEQIEPSLKMYDYITLIGVWEYSGLYISGDSPYTKLLQLAKKHLKPTGKIFIAIENKMGIKYWNGACEDHTGQQFSGLQNYVGHDNVRTFSKSEIETIFHEQGINNYTFYYPMPDYKLPDVIYTDAFLPQPGMERNFRKDYSEPRQYLFNDAIIMDQICSDQMFPYFANSFLIVIGDEGSTILFCKYNRQRKREFRTKIAIFEDNSGRRWVRKSPLTKEAEQHVREMKDKESFVSESRIPMLCPNGKVDEYDYVSEYIDGQNLNSEFYKFLDSPAIIQKIKEIHEMLTKSASGMRFCTTETYTRWFGDVFPKESCYTLHWTNIDLSLSNLKTDSTNRLYCIDYEWVFKFPIPIDYVTWRTINELYYSYGAYLNKIMSMTDFCCKVGIKHSDLKIFTTMEANIAERIFGPKHSELYLKRYIKPFIQQNFRLVL